MNLKKSVSIILVLLVIGIAAVTAWEQCFVAHGVSIGHDGYNVILDNLTNEVVTVTFTVVMEDDSEHKYQNKAVGANSIATFKYASGGNNIKNVVPCW
jgi:hypothetical protein